MPITAHELYIELLKIAAERHNRYMDSLDTIKFGNVEKQLRELALEGKIEFKNGIDGGFYVLK